MPAPTLVQSEPGTNTTSNTLLDITFGSNTGSGHLVIVAAGNYKAASVPHITGITLGGAADNFAVAEAESGNSCDAEIWGDPSAASAQDLIAVTFSASSLNKGGAAMEWANVGAQDTSAKNGGTGSGTSWSSGSSGVLSQPGELVIGIVFVEASAALTITGPGSPWTNLAQIAVSADIGALVGYQVVSGTGAVTYSGTTTTGGWAAAIAAFKPSAASAVPRPIIGMFP
jgi:hypothetical protein